MEKRTSVDFKDHELIIKESDDLSIYHLKKPNTYWDSVKFINTNGIMAVTGDYSNWIFCREFYPKGNVHGVSEQYWCEKLSISSTQKYKEFDYDATRKEIQDLILEHFKEDNDDKYNGAELEYLEDLLNYVEDGEERYCVFAYDNAVGRFDFENIPLEYKLNHQLQAIFDAFDEICKRVNNIV